MTALKMVQDEAQIAHVIRLPAGFTFVQMMSAQGVLFNESGRGEEPCAGVRFALHSRNNTSPG